MEWWSLLLVAAAALVGLLVIPIDLFFDGVIGGRSRVQVEWLFGAVRKELRADRRSSPQKPTTMPRRRSGRKVWAMARSPGFLSGLARFLKRLISAIEIDSLWANVTFGLEDPADTAFVFGVLQALHAPLQNHPSLRLELVPDYLDSGLGGRASGRIRAVPLQLIFETARFLTEATTVRALLL